MENRLILIDAYHYLHRSYHALPGLATKSGEEVGALYGFIRTVLKVLKRFEPTHVVVCWDSKPTERLRLEPAYKAHRPTTPETLKAQIAWSKELVQAWGLPNIEIQGHEADDLMASLAQVAEAKGFRVVLVTSDKDVLQIVSDTIEVYLEHKEEIMNVDALNNRYGFPATQIVDYFALLGDAVDNIEGVPGIGEKTAKSLVQKFGTVKNILEVALQSSGSISQKLQIALTQNRERVLHNRELLMLKKDLFADFKEEEFVCPKGQPPIAFRDLLIRFGFTSLLKDFGYENKKSVDLTTTILDQENNIVYDFKTLLRMRPDLASQVGKDFLDLRLLAWISNPSEESYNLDWLLARYGTSKPQELARKLQDQLERDGTWKLYQELERPLLGVLYEMERSGIAVDEPYLKELGGLWSRELETLRQEIIASSSAPQDLNLNSPKQLSYFFFEKLNLPKIKKTKTGYSTDDEVLHKLIGAHPVIAKIIEHRELSKLQSTYVEGLLEAINPKTGRIHATFHQEGTQTGRLSCSNPNLQNIPIRTLKGQKIRRAFIPTSGNWLFLSLDYSQIDLRVLAHLSEDATLIEIFRQGGDIHAETARTLLVGDSGTPITSEMRRQAKAVNFGVLYGMSAWGLSKELNIPTQEAQAFIDLYYNRFPQVRSWIDQTINEARRTGYVKTLLGRIRYLSNINHPQDALREFSERAAVNTPVQGTSADLIKMAMIKINEFLKNNNLESRMLVQIHDDILLEGPERELKGYAKDLKSIMENVAKLKTPILVNVKIGLNWQDLHDFSAI